MTSPPLILLDPGNVVSLSELTDIEAIRYDYFREAHAWVEPVLADAGQSDEVPAFLEAPNQVNVFGVRCMSDWKVNPAPVFNEWDDFIVQVWIDETGRKRCEGFKATVDPGRWDNDNLHKYFHDKNLPCRCHPITTAGDGTPVRHFVAHLCDGHWKYRYGMHVGKYEAGNPIPPFTCWLDYNFGDAAAPDPKLPNPTPFSTSKPGTDLHWGTGAHVGLYSAGCQVVWTDSSHETWNRFWGRLTKARDSAGQQWIPYTLIDSSKLRSPERLLQYDSGAPGDAGQANA